MHVVSRKVPVYTSQVLRGKWLCLSDIFCAYARVMNGTLISFVFYNLILDSFTACLLWSSKDVPIMCAGQANSGSVDNRHQFFNVFHQNSVEKPLVPFLDAHQVDVSGRKRRR